MSTEMKTLRGRCCWPPNATIAASAGAPISETRSNRRMSGLLKTRYSTRRVGRAAFHSARKNVVCPRGAVFVPRESPGTRASCESGHMPLLLPIALALSMTAQALQFQYPAPPAGAVVAMRDVEYGVVGGTTLKMDVYRPGGDASIRRPVLIFFNRATGADRSGDFYRGWAQTAASKGIVGILPDLRDGTQAQELDALLSHLTSRGHEYGIDANAIAV